MQTPDGYVYRKHWEALLTYENTFKANLSITYKLTPGHIKPEQYQKMNVLLAIEVNHYLAIVRFFFKKFVFIVIFKTIESGYGDV